MTQSHIITLGWRYERATGARAQALRQIFTQELGKLTTPEARQHYIYLFNQGRHEARGSK